MQDSLSIDTPPVECWTIKVTFTGNDAKGQAERWIKENKQLDKAYPNSDNHIEYVMHVKDFNTFTVKRTVFTKKGDPS